MLFSIAYLVIRDFIFSAFAYSFSKRSLLRLEETLRMRKKMRLFSFSVSMIFLLTGVGNGFGVSSLGLSDAA